MARNTRSKLREVQTVELTDIERVQVSWVLGTKKTGYKLHDAEYVGAIISELGLEDLGEVLRTEWDNTNQYSLSGYELDFLKKELKMAFDEERVQAVRVIPCLSLYHKLVDVLSGAEEEEEDQE